LHTPGTWQECLAGSTMYVVHMVIDLLPCCEHMGALTAAGHGIPRPITLLPPLNVSLGLSVITALCLTENITLVW